MLTSMTKFLREGSHPRILQTEVCFLFLLHHHKFNRDNLLAIDNVPKKLHKPWLGPNSQLNKEPIK
jgi:hypothetical protein